MGTPVILERKSRDTTPEPVRVSKENVQLVRAAPSTTEAAGGEVYEGSLGATSAIPGELFSAQEKGSKFLLCGKIRSRETALRRAEQMARATSEQG